MYDHFLGATPPLQRHSPLSAGLFGLCLGPLGTAWTLAADRDLFMTGTVCIVTSNLLGGKGLLLGMAFSGVYGALRVACDNARIEAAERAAAAKASAEVVDWPPTPLAFEAIALALIEMLAKATPEFPATIDDPRPMTPVEPALLPKPAPDVVEVPAAELPAEIEPLPPPPAAPRKRGRTKAAGKLAA